MFPDTIIGLIIFAAAIGPGYVYVVVTERREPRQERSTLLEAAELIAVGGISSTVAGIVVLVLSQSSGWLDVPVLLRHTARYFSDHAPETVGALLLAFALSYTGAWAAARVVHHGKLASLRPEYSVWLQTFRGSAERIERPPFVTVELLDGRLVAGFLAAYTVDPDPESRELALQAPLFARANARADRVTLEDDYVVLPGQQIVYLTVKKQPAVPVNSSSN